MFVSEIRTPALGKLLRQARESKEITTTYVALKLNVNPSFIVKLERGENYPPPELFVALCKLLEIEVPEAWELLKKDRMWCYETRLRREYRQPAGRINT